MIASSRSNNRFRLAFNARSLTVVLSKVIIKEYYGAPQAWSYYSGCSTGGRQGLKEIQMFPNDFDGVLIGSPANRMANLLPWEIHINLNVLPVDSPQWIPAETWASVIHPDVQLLRQCDALDGVVDGLISNLP
jgi:feruloyl esterase